MRFAPVAHPGVLHQYTSRLTAFEHQGSGASEQSPHHTILFLAGIADGFGHPTYPGLLARFVPAGWSVVEVLLSSSYTGWTTSSLERDANELVRAVKYFRSLQGRGEEEGGKIVLMGHSTGSQICLEYLVGPWKELEVRESTLQRPKVDGVIFQAGISDREGLSEGLTPAELSASLQLAKTWVNEDRGEDILPNSAIKSVFGADPSARRWVSLADPEGDDDYFSSDLPDARLARTFGEVGRRRVPACMLLGEQDEHMPGFVDKETLIIRWAKAVVGAGGYVDGETGVVAGATHNLNRSDEGVREAFCQRIARIVQRFAASPAAGNSNKAERL